MIELELIGRMMGWLLVIITAYLGFVVVQYAYISAKADRNNLSTLLSDKRVVYHIVVPKLFRMIEYGRYSSCKYTVPDFEYIFVNSEIKELSIKRQSYGYLVKRID